MKPTVVVIDDDPSIRQSLGKVLGKEGYKVFAESDGAAGMKTVKRVSPTVILLDLKLPDCDGLDLLKKIKLHDPETQVVIISGHGDIEKAVQAMRLGASDFLKKPYELAEICLAVQKSVEASSVKSQLGIYKRREWENFLNDEMVGESPQLNRIRNLIDKVSTSDSTTVLIEGESGTGKELVAKSIHYNSGRSEHPMVEVNCSSFSERLLENELFGHEKGAFTDAHELKRGLVELADRGTLFLDEIGDMSADLQGKLLRFLEQRSFRRVGGTEDIFVDIRIIAASNKDLASMVKKGSFRGDLYYRLKVVCVDMPPLRERGKDVLLLARYFLEKFSKKFGKQFCEISQDVEQMLLSYSWPGNVRELKNVLERSVLLEPGPVLTPEALPAELLQAHRRKKIDKFLYPAAENGDLPALSEIEIRYIRRVLEQVEGNKSRAARILQISRQSLIERLRRIEEGEMSKTLSK